jgi:hypothetical protein
VNHQLVLVFAAEVVIAIGIPVGSAKIPDALVEGRPNVDGVGALLSAVDLAMILFGVLQSSPWAGWRPRSAGDPDTTPRLAGISLTAWLILAGLGSPRTLVGACCCCRLRSSWSRLENHASHRARPRRIVRLGLLVLARPALLLAAPAEREPANAAIVTVPSLLLGARLGPLASQHGILIASSQPVARSGEVGGFQYTAHNLGASLERRRSTAS